MSLILLVIKWGGEFFYLYVMAVMVAFQFLASEPARNRAVRPEAASFVLAVLIFPNFIQPCFNKASCFLRMLCQFFDPKVEPLEAGSLRAAVEALAGKLAFPLKDLFKIDGSTRSAHSNVLSSSLNRANQPTFLQIGRPISTGCHARPSGSCCSTR